MTWGDVPDAVVALIAAVIEDNPHVPPRRLAVLVGRELRCRGWHVVAPGVGGPVERASVRGRS